MVVLAVERADYWSGDDLLGTSCAGQKLLALEALSYVGTSLLKS